MDPLTVVPDATLGGFGLVAVIVGLVQVAKLSGLRARWAPMVATALGLALGGAAAATGSAELVDGIMGGLVSGLAAVGLYSGSRNLAGDPAPPPERYPGAAPPT